MRSHSSHILKLPIANLPILMLAYHLANPPLAIQVTIRGSAHSLTFNSWHGDHLVLSSVNLLQR